MFHLIKGSQIILVGLMLVTQVYGSGRMWKQLEGDDLEIDPTPDPNPNTTPTPTPTPNPDPDNGNSTNTNTTVPPALPSGGTYLMRPGSLRMITSPGFFAGVSQKDGVLTWSFQSDSCVLNATCPCMSIPPSIECLSLTSGYLKLRTGILYNVQRFCGENRPSNFMSDSGELTIRYLAGNGRRQTGFLCFVSCDAMRTPSTPIPSVGCPTFK